MSNETDRYHGLEVGVVFNGTVKHAGQVVTSGVRHLLVASFSIAANDASKPRSRWVIHM